MINRHYKFKQESLSNEEIEEFKDFDEVLDRFNNAPLPETGAQGWNIGQFFSGVKFWVIGAIVIVSTIILFQFGNSSSEGTASDLVADDLQEESLNNHKGIQPPFPEHDVPYEEYTINADSMYEIITANGSIVRVEDQSFAYSDGSTVTGEVVLKYREVHDPVSIFQTGVPMTYDTLGKEKVFESAGMFELIAFQNGKVVNLNKGKTIDVEMVSLNDDPNFNMYYYDTTLGGWTFISKREVISRIEAYANLKSDVNQNTDEATGLQEDELPIVLEEVRRPIKPILPKVMSDKFSFEAKFVSKKFPELPKETIFQVDEDFSDFNPIYYDVTWDNIELKRSKYDKRYTLVLYKGNEIIELEAYPALSEEDYESIMKSYNDSLELYLNYLEAQRAIEFKNNEQKEEVVPEPTSEVKRITYKRKRQKQSDASQSRVINPSSKVIYQKFKVSKLGWFNSGKVAMDINSLTPVPKKKRIKLFDQNGDEFIAEKMYTSNRDKLFLLNNRGNLITYSEVKKNISWAVVGKNELAVINENKFEGRKKAFNATRYNTEEGLLQLDQLLNK